jgi:hypothetical protein
MFMASFFIMVTYMMGQCMDTVLIIFRRCGIKISWAHATCTCKMYYCKKHNLNPFVLYPSVWLFAEDFSENAVHGKSDKDPTERWKCSSDSKSKPSWSRYHTQQMRHHTFFVLYECICFSKKKMQVRYSGHS